jgi:3-methyladenine DNA glycosylase AlkD
MGTPAAPGDARAIAAEIRGRLAAAEHWTAAGLRQVRREYTRHLATAEPAVVLRVALELIPGPMTPFPHRCVAYELVLHHRTAPASLKGRDVEALGQGIDGWAAVDTFACYISGPAWREGQVSDAMIHRWSRSPDRWWRRAALVSTVPLNCKARGGHGDTPRTLAVCSRLLQDRDDMVVKAMSWALRELSKRDAAAVRSYLAAHGEAVAARVVREVGNKLRTGLKNPRKA